ncbi:hypothetical protein HNQ76_001193 [Thermosulfuriphilus ammonigenes]|nr:cytochrome c3 family protein [Thermosulfuriphilus ammonigenes]MBA2848809.1 hypothetical protein [Thermosulfuriphilus ammonigenes]
MNKVWVWVMAVFCGLGLTLGGMAIAGEGPAVFKLENRKGTVTFNHHAHQALGLKCGACHHGVEGGKKVPYKAGQKNQKCETCHNKGNTSMPAKYRKPMSVFHKTCKGCHKKMAANHPKAPTKCNGCHKK